MIRPPPRSPLFPSTTLFRSYDTGYSDGLSTPIGAPDFPLPDWGKLDWALSQTNLNNSFTASVIYDLDRKSTRLNSSHGYISYAVFCLKKQKQTSALTLHPSA